MRKWISAVLAFVMLFSMLLTPTVAKAATEETYPKNGYVNADKVNVRTGPGTSYDVAYRLNTDDPVTIQQQAQADGLEWGQLTDGNWIALKYVTITETSEFPKEGVVNGTNVRVRTGAGTSYDVAYKLNTNDPVTIQQQIEADGLQWGQLADGNWICLDYVTFTETEPEEPEDTTEPEEPEDTTDPEEPEDTTDPETPEDTTDPETPETSEFPKAGTVNGTKVRVRAGAGTSYDVVYYLNTGDAVTIQQQVTIGDLVWGQLEDGNWICLDYVTFTETDSGGSEDTTEPEEPEVMTSSQAFVDILKSREGFRSTPYWDVSHYSIGYGTSVPSSKVDYYKNNPITEAEGEAMMREHLLDFEKAILKFADKYSLTLTQNQFDGLVSFSYNCGDSWLRETSGNMNRAVREGWKGSDFVYAMLLWSKAGTDYILMNRRMYEADMYLNNHYQENYDYENGTFRYAFLEAGLGTVRYIVHGFDYADPKPIRYDITKYPTGVDKNGNAFTYRFAGWYTAPENGTRVTILDDTIPKAAILYAMWEDPDGNVVYLQKGTPCENLKVTVTNVDKSVTVRSGPGTFYSKAGTLKKGTVVTLLRVYDDGKIVWGQCESGWFSLKYSDYDGIPEEDVTEELFPQYGVVTGNDVNVRNGAGTGNSVQYQLDKGTQVTILQKTTVGSTVWGQLEDGNWMSLNYVSILCIYPERYENGWIYEVIDETAKLKRYNGTLSGQVKLPATLGGYPVTAIESKAFYQNTALTMLTLPESVTGIGEAAFSGCTALLAVNVPESVTEVGSGVFAQCSSLAHVAYGGTREQWNAMTGDADLTGLHCETVLVDVDNCVESGVYCPACLDFVLWQEKADGAHSFADGSCTVCGESQYQSLKLTEDSLVEWNLEADLYVDLAGFDLSGTIVTNGYRVYCMDSTTNGYTSENVGYFTCVDEAGGLLVPEQICTYGNKQYMAICTEDRYSFHRFFVGVTHMSLEPEAVGLGYKAAFFGDEMVLGQLDTDQAFRFRLQLEGYQPVYRYFTSRDLASGEAISLRIRNYDVEKHSETELAAQVGLKLADGTVIEAEPVSLTFRWLTEQVNANYADYTSEQLAQFKTMLQAFDVVKAWDIPNLM